MEKRFFNLVPDASGNIATIFLYGEIGEYSEVKSGAIARELLEAVGRYNKINVRINSLGGDVYAGIAIFNALRNSPADITIYVDGVAASMSSVIALCGKPVQMSRYARLMLHSISGLCYGNKRKMKQCIEDIESLEDTLCEMYAKKCNMTEEEIRARYFDDDNDHWLTANQALDLGFIDGIYDADPVPEDSTPEQIYTTFNNRLKSQPQNENKMNIDDLRKRPRFQNCATDDDVLHIVEELETEAAKVPGLSEEVTRLDGEVKAYEAKEKAALEAEDDTLLDAAETDGRIDATTRPTYKALMGSDRTNGRAALAALKPQRRVMRDLANPDQPTEDGAWAKRQKEIEEKNAKK